MQETAKPASGAGGWGGAPQPALTLPGGRTVNPWMVLASLMFGFFMSLLDATIVNIALPNIQDKLQTDLTTVSWVLNAYNLVFAVLLVTMGRFADQYGRKRLFMIGMVLFSLGSLLCAVSPNIGFLIGARALQAIGSAALNPVSLAVITVVFPANKRGAAIGVWGAAAGLAAALGPVLGGVLVQAFDWRWIFFINLPFCIVGLFMVYRYMPETKDANATKSVDILGLLTLTLGMFCLVLAIIQGSDWGWTDGRTLGLFAGSVLGFVLFFFVEVKQAQPILDFKLFRIRSFSAANASIFMFSVAIQGAFLMLVLFFTNAQGYDQIGAAYGLIPLPLASFVVSAVAGRLSGSGKLNPRIMGIIGIGTVAVGLGLLVTLGPTDGYFDTAWRAVIIGLGMGLCFTSFPTMALADVPRNKVGVGSGAFNTFRQLGFALGVAILIGLFTTALKDDLAQARTRSAEIVRAETRLPEGLRTSIATGLLSANNAAQSGGGEASNSRNGGQQQVDLIKQIETNPNIPAAVKAQVEPLRPVLLDLNRRIAFEFKTGVVQAFSLIWLVATVIAILGLIPAFFTSAPKRAPAGAASDRPVAVME